MTALRRIAIVERGEPAMRLIRAVRELGGDVSTIALYGESDRHALFVREADDAVQLPGVGPEHASPGLACLERGLRAARADAAWVGWGPLARDPRAAEVCERVGVVFIGPPASAMRLLGDEASLRRLAEQAGLEVAPRNGAVDGARRIDVQVIADARGTAWAVGVRDSTLRRRDRAVLVEAPSPIPTAAEETILRAAAVRLVKAASYRGVGTVELLFDPKRRTASFIGLDPCLGSEHAVTEETTGIDLVKLQLHVAAGGRLTGKPPPSRGHAVAVQLCTESPQRQGAATPGPVALCRLPSGPGVRVDTGLLEGDAIPGSGEAPIARITATGSARAEALARLRRALVETRIVIPGGATDKAFLLALLDRPDVRDGTCDTGRLDGVAMRGDQESLAHADVALLAAAVEASEAELEIERTQFLATAARGRPAVSRRAGNPVELRYRGLPYRFTVHCIGRDLYRIETGPARVTVRVDRFGPFERRLEYLGRHHRILSAGQGLEQVVEVDGVPHRVSRDAAGIVRATMPAIVLSLAVRPGDEVHRGDRLAVLESMKMEVGIPAPFAGRVRRLLAQPNQHVAAGAPLLVLEPLTSTGEEDDRGEPVTFPAVAGAAESDDARARWRRVHDIARRLLLGWDVDPAEARAMAEHWGAVARELPPDDPEVLADEDDLLDTFVDLHALFRRPHVPEDEQETSAPRPTEEYLVTYLRALETRGAGLPESFLARLQRVLGRQGVTGLEPGPALEHGLLRIARAAASAEEQLPAVMDVLDRRLGQRTTLADMLKAAPQAERLDRLTAVAEGRFPALVDLAREAKYRFVDQPLLEHARDTVYAEVRSLLARALASTGETERAALIERMIDCPQPLVEVFLAEVDVADPQRRRLMLEIITRRYYRIRALGPLTPATEGDMPVVTGEYPLGETRVHLISTLGRRADLPGTLARLRARIAAVPAAHDVVVDCFLSHGAPLPAPPDTARALAELLAAAGFGRPIRRIVFALSGAGTMQYFTFRSTADGWAEDTRYRGLHPMIGERLHLKRLEEFAIERLPSVEDVYLFRGVARANPRDERLFALAEVRDLTPVRDAGGRVVGLPYLERMLLEALAAIRDVQAHRPAGQRLQWNRILLYLWPPLTLAREEVNGIIRRLAPATLGVGLEQVQVRARMPDGDGLHDTVIRISDAGGDLLITFGEPSDRPLRPLAEHEQTVVALRRRGLIHPSELIRMLAPPRGQDARDLPPGEFIEHDLGDDGTLIPVERPPGSNRAKVVVGVIRNFTAEVPEGMARVIVLGDASKEMGALAEPECARINAALDLAERMRVPLEWFALSAGAKISMESGTENMDWISRVLRRLIEFTQAGGEVNVVVCGINVGAQPYWNAEATMLMHTKGILVMAPGGAMVLTGKQALDYSGGVSAEDNLGIGGYDRIMGPNGQAQYHANDLGDACRILLRHYEYSYVVPGERGPRHAATADPPGRDVCAAPHGGAFARVGDVFSEAGNPGRKQPFDIRPVMRAVIDQDHRPLERWRDMRDAEVPVVWDARIGGHAVCVIGFESHPLPRLGFIPADGPDRWTGGTLFPRGSKKVARAINAASNNRPLVILANLSGFDGSPESMREWQLEYGAEIGRAVVNFRGPIVFVVVSRYHGGAFVVFSKALNERIEAAALEGSYASVIGGAPAAAVVFTREVDTRTAKDGRIRALEEEVAVATAAEKPGLRARLAELRATVRTEHLGRVAEEYDHVHSVERALRTGSIDAIIPAARMRPWIIAALERGLAAGR